MNKIKEALAVAVIPRNSPLFKTALKLADSGLFEPVGRYLVRRYDGLFKVISVAMLRSSITICYDLVLASNGSGKISLALVRDYQPLTKGAIEIKEGRGRQKVRIEANGWKSVVLGLPFPALKLKIRGPKYVKIEEFLASYGTYYVSRTLALGKYEARNARPGFYGFTR